MLSLLSFLGIVQVSYFEALLIHEQDVDTEGYQLFCQDCLVPEGKMLIHAHDDAVGDDRQDDHVPAGHRHHMLERIVWGH